MYTNKVVEGTLIKEPVAAHQEVTIAHIRDTCLKYGMPEEWFPKETINQERLLNICRMWGTLPEVMQAPQLMSILHPTDKLVSKYPPQVRTKVKADFPSLVSAFYVFTAGEEWWKGEPCFPVTNMAQYANYCLYVLAKNDIELRDFEPPVLRGPGRPSIEKEVGVQEQSSVKQEREEMRKQEQDAKKAKTQAHKVWLSQCANHRAKVAELKAIYESKFAEAEEARKAWRKLESDGAPPRPL